jgi:hypothetical protein
VERAQSGEYYPSTTKNGRQSVVQSAYRKEEQMGNRATFRIAALPAEPFAAFFKMDDEQLATHGARRQIADAKPGYPCRVSLVDAEPGERLILLPYQHHDVASPYRSSGPIYVRENAKQAEPKTNEVPDAIRRRLLSIRAYDANGFMLDAEVAEGRELEDKISGYFADSRVAYLHLHNARPGCYSCRVDRVMQ